MLLRILTVLSAVVAVITGICSGSFAGLAWLWVLPVTFIGCWLGLFLLLFLFLLLACAPVDVTKPREADSPFYRKLIERYAEAAMSIIGVHIETKGVEKLPKDGRFMLVCNHISDLDPVVLLLTFRKSQLAFISKQENTRKFIIGKVMHMILCQPINRENDREALKTILKCIQIIKEDKASIAVFPEGYTSRDRLLHPFRSGVFKIAQKANVPIVVCTVQNTHKAFRNIAHLKSTDVKLHLLDVIPAEELKGVTAMEIGERVHRMMADDLGPDLVLQNTENT